jgi:hypothetical protein
MGKSLNIRVMDRLVQISELNWINNHEQLKIPFGDNLAFVLKDHVEEWNELYSAIENNENNPLALRMKQINETLNYIPLFSYLYAEDRPIIISQNTGATAFNLNLPEDAVLIREVLDDIKTSNENIDPYLLNAMMKIIVKKTDTTAMESFFIMLNELVENDRVHRASFSIMKKNLSSDAINHLTEQGQIQNALPDIEDVHEFFRIATKHSLNNIFGDEYYYSYAHSRALAIYLAYDHLSDGCGLKTSELLGIQQKYLDHLEINEANMINRLRSFMPDRLKDHAHISSDGANKFFSRYNYDISLIDNVLKREINSLSSSLGTDNSIAKIEELLGCSWVEPIQNKVKKMIDGIESNLRDDIARKFYQINVEDNAAIKKEQEKFIDEMRSMLITSSDEFKRIKTKDVLMRFESISGFVDAEFRNDLFKLILESQAQQDKLTLDKIDSPADYMNHFPYAMRRINLRSLTFILKGFAKIKGSRSEKPSHNLIQTLHDYTQNLNERVKNLITQPAGSVSIREAFEVVLSRKYLFIMLRHMEEQFYGKTTLKQFKLNELIEIDGELKTPYQSVQDITSSNIENHYLFVDALTKLYPQIEETIKKSHDSRFNQTQIASRFLSSEYTDAYISEALDKNGIAQLYADFREFGDLEPLLDESIYIAFRLKVNQHMLSKMINDEMESADLLRIAEMDLANIKSDSRMPERQEDEIIDSIYENTL